MNILIPNATGPTNIGDQAILIPLINLIKSVFPKANLVIHSSVPDRYRLKIADKIDHTLYSWSVFENKSTVVRIYRVLLLILNYWLVKYNLQSFANNHLKSLISDYKNADMIVFVGGGYLRSQKGLSQSLNLFMICFLFQFSKLFNKKKIIAPTSFGPFAYSWQEKLCAAAMNGFDVVAAREEYSYDLLHKNNVKNIIQSVDTALLMKSSHEKYTKNRFILGFTIRKWLDKERQKIFEEYFTDALVRFVKKTASTIQPIVQVDAPIYGDVDYMITQSVSVLLKRAHIKSLPIKIVKSLQSANEI